MLAGVLVLFVAQIAAGDSGPAVGPAVGAIKPTGASPAPILPTVDANESSLAEQANPPVNPPPYTLLRFNENSRSLAAPANRTDRFDSLKYISLDSNNPNSYLSL